MEHSCNQTRQTSFVYRDELDKWLETGRKVQVPLTFEEEQTQMLAATRRKANPKNV